jgi:hypothetical protein
LTLSELRELQLRAENRKLKTLVADLTLDKHILAGGALKNSLKPAVRRQLVREVRQAHRLSEQHACGLFGITPLDQSLSKPPRPPTGPRM